MTIQGTGTFQLAGINNTYLGTTTINRGTLQGGVANALPLNSIVVLANTSGACLDLNGFNQSVGSLSGGGTSGGNVSLGTGTLTIAGSNISTSYAGAITGTGGLTIQGTGTFQLAGINNTYLGTTTINRGTLQGGVANALPSNSVVVMANTSGAGLDLNGFNQSIGALSGGGTIGGNIALGTGTLSLGSNNASSTYAGAISGSGGLTKQGSGTFRLAGINNTYLGTTTVSGGTLQAGVGNAFPVNSTVVLANTAGVDLDLNGLSQTIGSLSGGGSLGGNVSLGVGILTVGGNNANTSYSGAISGTGGLTKQGTGILDLTGINTYLGSTIVNAGILQAGGNGAFPTDTRVVMGSTPGATLDLNSFNQTISSLSGGASGVNITLGTATLTIDGANINTVYSGGISGTGGLTISGTGTFSLSGTNNTYFGTTQLNSGILLTGVVNALSPNSAVVLANSFAASLNLNDLNQSISSLSGGGLSGGNVNLGLGTLTIDGSNINTTYSGMITGTGGLTIQGTGTFQLAGINLYLGTTTINAGTLQVGAANALPPLANSVIFIANAPTAGLDLNNINETIGTLSGGGPLGGQVSLGTGTLTLSGSANSTYAGGISGTGGLTKQGTGIFQLAGTNNTYLGTTTISAGTLQAGATNALPLNSTVVIANVAGAGLDLNGFNAQIGSLSGGGTTGGTVSLGLGTLTLNGNNISTTYSGSIIGLGGLTINGTGTFQLSGTNNTYSGTTTVNRGKLRAGAANSLPSNSIVVMGNNPTAILDLNNFNTALASLSGGGSAGGSVTLGTGTLTLDGNNINTTYSGSITGTGGLTIQGTGTFQLAGTNNTYLGTTTINRGTLQAGATNAFPSNSVVVLANAAGAGLDLNGFNQSVGSLSGGGLSGGNVALGTGTLTIAGSNINTIYGGAITGTGGLTIQGTGTFQLAGTNNTYFGTTTVNRGTLQGGVANALPQNSIVVMANAAGAGLDLNGFNQSVGSLSGGGSLGGNVTLGIGALTISGSNINTIYGGAITGTGGLTIQGTGTFQLAGTNNTYLGTTTINRGTIQGGVTNALPSNSVVVLANASGAGLDLNGFNQSVGSLSGGGSLGGNVVLGSGTLTIVGSNINTIYAGAITGAGGLTIQGTGTFQLAGINNTYLGTTTVNRGTLQGGVANALPQNSVVVMANAAGAGLDLNGFNQSIGSLSGGGLLGGNVALGAGTLTIDGSNINATYSGSITGAGGLTLQGTGIFRLGGTNNTYGGTTTINRGTLQAAVANALPSNSIVIMGNNAGAALDLNNFNTALGSLSGGGTLGGNVSLGTGTLTIAGSNINTIYSGAITGTGGLTIQGTGTFQLAGTNNSYLGTTTINRGTLQGGATNVLPLNSVVVLANASGAGLDLNGFNQSVGSLSGGGTLGGNVALGTGTLTIDGANINTTYSGSISGIGGLTIQGTGTFQLAGTNNTYLGTTTINRGTLQGGVTNALPSNSVVVLANASGAGLDLNGFNQSVGSLSGGGSLGGNVVLGSGTLTIVGSNINTIYAGAITGAGGLTIQGTGTFQLAGANNTYAGTTTINRGTLQGGATNALPLNSIVVLANTSGAGLDLNGFNQVVGSLSGGGTLGGNVALGTGTLTIDGNNISTTYSGAITGAGGLTIQGTGTFRLAGTNNTYFGTTTINSGTLQAGVMDALPSNSIVVMGNNASAALDLNNFDAMIGSLSGGGTAGGTVSLGTGTLTINGSNINTVYSGAIIGTGGLTIQGTGTFQLAGTNNTYLGTTTINRGTLQGGAIDALPLNSIVILANTSGAGLDLNGFNQIVGSLSGGGTAGGNVALGTGTLTIDGSNINTIYSGAITGAGGLIIQGTGTFQLAGASNTYFGTTTINRGTLQAGVSNALPTNSSVVIANVATAALDLNNFNATIGSLSGGGSLGGNVSLGSATLTLGGNNTDTSYAGRITGSGGLIKQGAGTFQLDGTNNTYSGTTTVNGGTLQAGAVGAFSTSLVVMANTAGAALDLNGFSQTISSLSGGGSAGGNVSLGGGTLTLLDNITTIYSGAISGTGELVKQGAGTFQLAGGNNTYSGTTTIASGMLVFTGNTSGLSGNIVNDSILIFNQPSNSSLSGAISGPGAVTQNGSAVITLAGNNTYGGLTTINSGGITFTGDTSGMTGNIANGGSLTFDQASNAAFQGAISGTGTVTKNGAGTLTLDGANTYSGNTAVVGGTLKAGASGVFSPNSSVIMNNTTGAILDLNGFNQTILSLSGGGASGGNVSLGSGTLTTGNSANVLYAGVISGGGGVTKEGSGIFSLSGVNTFTGIMQVLSGELNLNGSVGGDVSIASGALLTGTGTVGGNLVINSGGTISPGNSIGTFHVSGNFTNNGGNYLVEINGAGQSDAIDILGTATINGGAVIVTSVDGTYSLTDTYTILTAANVTGTYSSLVVTGLPVPPSLLTPKLTYDPQHVYLQLEVVVPTIHFLASTCNELAVATQIENILPNPTQEQAILINELVGLSALEVQAALDSLTGQQHTDDLLSTAVINRQFIRRLYDPIRSIITTTPCIMGTQSRCCNNDFDFWVEAGGGYTYLNGNGNAHGFDLNSYEITCGIQDTFCSDWTVGLAGGYEYDQFLYKHKGKGSSKTMFAGMYGLYRPSSYYALFDIAYGGSDNVVDRPIDVGTVHYRVRSNPKISQLTCYGEIGIDFKFKNFLMQPFGGIEIGSYWRKRIVEHPVAPSTGGWELVVSKRDRTNVYSRLGLHMTANDLPYRFAISLDLAWVKRLTCGDNALTMRFVEFGSNFNINGVPLNGNSADGAITISTQLLEQLRVYLEASGEIWNKAATYNGLGGFEFVF